MSPVNSWIDDGVGRIHLHDPKRRNALSKEVSDGIAVGVAAALADGASAIVLTAEPPVFCSGGSLDSLIKRDVPLRETYAGHLALFHSPVPTIAVVTGAAVGAGVNLPLACDIVIAGVSARFDPRFLDVGIHPGGAHLWRLSQRVGPQGAAALILLGDALNGVEAERHGLAWRCVPDDEALALALRFAHRTTTRSQPLLRRAKETLRATAAVDSFADSFELELAAQQWSVEQPEFADTVRKIQADIAARKKN